MTEGILHLHVSRLENRPKTELSGCTAYLRITIDSLEPLLCVPGNKIRTSDVLLDCSFDVNIPKNINEESIFELALLRKDDNEVLAINTEPLKSVLADLHGGNNQKKMYDLKFTLSGIAKETPLPKATLSMQYETKEPKPSSQEGKKSKKNNARSTGSSKELKTTTSTEELKKPVEDDKGDKKKKQEESIVDTSSLPASLGTSSLRPKYLQMKTVYDISKRSYEYTKSFRVICPIVRQIENVTEYLLQRFVANPKYHSLASVNETMIIPYLEIADKKIDQNLAYAIDKLCKSQKYVLDKKDDAINLACEKTSAITNTTKEAVGNAKTTIVRSVEWTKDTAFYLYSVGNDATVGNLYRLRDYLWGRKPE